MLVYQRVIYKWMMFYWIANQSFNLYIRHQKNWEYNMMEPEKVRKDITGRFRWLIPPVEYAYISYE
jgi:hypothetical protein